MCFEKKLKTGFCIFTFTVNITTTKQKTHAKTQYAHPKGTLSCNKYSPAKANNSKIKIK